MRNSKLYEERKIAIHLLRSGCSVQTVAHDLKRSVRWVYKWQTCFEQESWAGLAGQSQAPKQHGKKVSPKIRQEIEKARSELEAEVEEENRLSYIGGPAVQARLGQKKIAPLPSVSTIERVLKAAGMTNKTPPQPTIKYPHLHPTEPHRLVQVDIVPHYLKGGEIVACFNAIDVVSRYPTGQALAQRRAKDAVAFLIHVWQEIGLPRYTQTDNEACFSGGFTHKGVLGQVLRLALFVGTQLVFSPVRHPKSNGTIERFHQDYNRHVWEKTLLQNRKHVNEKGTSFFQEYRISAHHSALKGQTPTKVHHHSPPKRLPIDFELPPGKLPLTIGKVHFIRRVKADGIVSVLNLEWQIPDLDPMKGVWVTIDFALNGATLSIYDAPPNVNDRTCFATHPFPLVEKVQPKKQDNSDAPILMQFPFEFMARSMEFAFNFFSMA